MTIRKRISPSLYNIQDLGASNDKFERAYIQNVFADQLEGPALIVDNLTVKNIINGNQTPTIFNIISAQAHKFDADKTITLQGAISGNITTDFENNQLTIDTFINLQTLTSSIGQVLQQDLVNLQKYNNLITNLGFQQLQNTGSNLVLNLANASNNTLGKYIYDLNSSISSLEDYIDTNFISITQKGSENGVAELDGNGKILLSQIPSINISNTYTVATINERDELQVESGDIAIVTDSNQAYMWNGINWVAIASGQGLQLNLQNNQIPFTTDGSTLSGSNALQFKNYSGTGLTDKTLVVDGDPNFNTTIKTAISAAATYNGTYSGLTIQNKSNSTSASTNIYLKNEGNSEVADYAVLGLEGKLYNSGSDYMSEKAKSLYLGNSNGDITIMPNFLADTDGGSVHLTYENGAKAISITNSGGLSVQTTFDINTQQYVTQTGNSGDVLVSGGSNSNINWVSKNTLLNDVNWIVESFNFNNVLTENGSQYFLTSQSIKKLSNIPQLKVVLNGLELNSTEYSVPVLPANRVNIVLTEGSIENGDIVKIWYIKQ